MTVTAKVRRQQRAVDTSGQLDFVVELARSREDGPGPSVAPSACAPAAGPGKAPRFVEKDPHVIFIGAVRLDEHLKAMSIKWPFVVGKLLAGVDWRPFIASCSPDGRPGYHPRLMAGLLLGGIMKGVDSLRGLEELARCDLGIWWLTGGICPDHSVIGRFILLHEKVLTDAFFRDLTGRVLAATGSSTSTVAADGTVIAAAVARAGTLRKEALAAARAKAEERTVAPAPTAVDADAAAEADKLGAAMAELDRRIAARTAKGRDPKNLCIHPDETEAVVQPQKDDTFAPSYKPTVLANAARVVLAADVHPSSETAVMAGLLDEAGKHGRIDTAFADAGFNCAPMIEATSTREIELLAPEGRTIAGEADTAKRSDERLLKSRFAYDAASDSYRCPAGHVLLRVETTKECVEYGGAPCADCPLRSRCTKAAGGRRIKRYPADAAKEAMRAKLAQPEHRQRYNQRAGMVEPVFAHVKEVQGLRRFRRRGLAKVRLEWMLHMAAHNMSRAVALACMLPALVWGLASGRAIRRWITARFRELPAAAPPSPTAHHWPPHRRPEILGLV